MKIIIFTVTVLVSVSLLVPSASFSQTHNFIGLYFDTDATINAIDMAPGAVDIYIILTEAYNENHGQEVTQISGFECGLNFTGTASIFSGSWAYPTVSLVPIRKPFNA